MTSSLRSDIALWMGTMPELGIGSAQALMFATHPGCRYPTDVEPSQRWYTDDIVSQIGHRPVDGDHARTGHWQRPGSDVRDSSRLSLSHRRRAVTALVYR